LGRPRRANKVDANQAEIVETLRAIPGCTVYVINDPVDLMVGWMHATWLFEIKNKDGKNVITQRQKDFIEEWTGGKAYVVHGAYEIIQIMTGHSTHEVQLGLGLSG